MGTEAKSKLLNSVHTQTISSMIHMLCGNIIHAARSLLIPTHILLSIYNLYIYRERQGMKYMGPITTCYVSYYQVHVTSDI